MEKEGRQKKGIMTEINKYKLIYTISHENCTKMEVKCKEASVVSNKN